MCYVLLSQAAPWLRTVVRPTCKVNGKVRILTPNDIKIPEIFQISTWRSWLPSRDLTYANFHFNPFSGGFSPDRWNITVLWLFTWLLGSTVFFFSGTRPGRIRGWNFTVYGSYNVFSSFWGWRQYRNSFGVIASRNSPKRGVNRKFQAKPAEYKNRDILQSIITINVQF